MRGRMDQVGQQPDSASSGASFLGWVGRSVAFSDHRWPSRHDHHSAVAVKHHLSHSGAGCVEQPESLTERDPMAGTLIVIAARLLFRRTHPEPSRRYPAQPLGDLLQSELDEDAVTVLPPTAGPVGWATGGQRMPGGVDDGGSVHDQFMVNSKPLPPASFLRGARNRAKTGFHGSAWRFL